MQHNFGLGLVHGRTHDEDCETVIDEPVTDVMKQDSRE